MIEKKKKKKDTLLVTRCWVYQGLDSIIIEKPWGHEIILGEWNGWRVKLLHINDGHRTSLQYHRTKDEYWFYSDGSVKHISPGTVHRLIGPVEVLELARGSDDDIVRLADDYERK